MKKHVLWSVIAVSFPFTLGLSGCESNSPNETVLMEPTPAELDLIDQAVDRAESQITPETADAEYEKLATEIDKE
jgi:hypothetical protein